MHHRNWRIFLAATSKEVPCRGQLYQKHKLERAFEIIDKSFTFGVKLKRNPVSEWERLEQAKKDAIEKQRFDIYKRAYNLKQRKSNSVGATGLGEKT